MPLPFDKNILLASLAHAYLASACGSFANRRIIVFSLSVFLETHLVNSQDGINDIHHPYIRSITNNTIVQPISV